MSFNQMFRLLVQLGSCLVDSTSLVVSGQDDSGWVESARLSSTRVKLTRSISTRIEPSELELVYLGSRWVNLASHAESA